MVYAHPWKEYELPLKVQCRWQIGPLNFIAQRLGQEYRFFILESGDLFDTEFNFSTSQTEEMPQHESFQRYALKKTKEKIVLSPALADRSIVIRPEMSFSILPKQKINVFVTTSMWVEVKETAPAQTIAKFSIVRPSDTWFGSDTLNGEFCYFSQTMAKLSYDELNLTPYRAITQVDVENESDKVLSLERFKLPAPNLALYSDEQGLYFTDRIKVTVTPTETFFQVKGPPKEHSYKLKMVKAPGAPLGKSIITKALHSLMS